jgi:hypothetical protein
MGQKCIDSFFCTIFLNVQYIWESVYCHVIINNTKFEVKNYVAIERGYVKFRSWDQEQHEISSLKPSVSLVEHETSSEKEGT